MNEHLQKIVGLKAVQDGSARERKKPLLAPLDVKKIWPEILIKEEPPAEIPLIGINSISVCTTENHSLVVGKKKSRKTLFLVWLLSQYTGDLGSEVLYFDTEQSRKHVYQVRRKLRQLTGKEVPVFYLRGMSPEERRRIISETIKQWPTRPKLVVVDGIRDLVSNINSEDQSTDLIFWLEDLVKINRLHVINVLHQNKTDRNPRGHLGTELGNKAEITIEIEKDEQAGCSVARSESDRDGPFQEFAFTHGPAPDGLPEIVSRPTKWNMMTAEEERERLRLAFAEELLQYGELVDQVKAHFEVGERKAKSLVTRFIHQGWITSNKVSNKKYPVYKLLI